MARILIVQSNRQLPEDFAGSLKSLGHDITGIAASAEETIRMVEEFRPDLVLMDISLAREMGGIETIDHTESRFEVPVVYLQELEKNDVVREAKHAEPYDDARTPIDLQELSGKIERALSKHKADTELRRSQEIVRESFVCSPIATALVSLDGGFTSVNPALMSMLGHSEKEMLQMQVSDIAHPHDVHEVLARFQDLLSGQIDRYDIEKRFVHKDGRTVWAKLNVGIVRDASGSPVYSVAHFIDISDRKETEEALRESEEILLTTLENTPDPVFVTNDDGQFIFVCPNILHVLGFSVQEVQAMGNISRVLGDGLFTHEELEARGEIRGIERIITDKHGRERLFLIGVKRVSIRGGTVLYACHEATEDKKAQEAILKSEKKYRLLVDNLPIGMFSVDTRGRILEINRRLLDLVGSPSAEATKTINVLTFPPLVKTGLPDSMHRCLEKRETQILEGAYTSTWGKEAYWRIMLTPTVDERGIVTGCQALVEDITERKRVSDELKESQKRLQERDELFQSFMNNGPVVAFMKDEMGHYVYINRPWEKAFGKEASEVLGKATQAIWPLESALLLQESDEAVLASNESLQFVSSLIDPKGNAIHLWVCKFPLSDPDGNRYVGGVALDITKQTEDEKALRESEERYRSVMEASSEPIVVYDSEGKVVYCNPAFERVFGWALDELLGKRTDYVPEENWPETKANMTELFECEKGYCNFESRRKTKDGRILDVIISASVYRDSSGNALGMIANLKDITQRKQAEESLRHSEERYALAQRAGNIGSWDWDIRSGNLTWSDNIESMFGFGYGEFGGTYEAFLTCVHPDDRQFVIDSVNVCIQEGRDYDIEHRIVWPNGKVRWMSEKGQVYHDERAKPVRMVGVVQDVTERRESEAEHIAYLSFLQNLERIDHVIRRAGSHEDMMKDVMESVMEMFACDRSWLLYPCDPQAPSFKVPVECASLQYPGAFAMNQDVPVGPGISEVFRLALEGSGPLTYGPGSQRPVPQETARHFFVQSQMQMALHPRVGKPWMFGIHQCSHARTWTEEEQRLFREIGNRLTDGLSSLLFLRDLRESEKKYRGLVENQPVGVVIHRRTGEIVYANPALYKILGVRSEDEISGRNVLDFVHPDFVDSVTSRLFTMLDGSEAAPPAEETLVRTDGRAVSAEITGVPITYMSEPAIQVMIEDITERKRAEQALRASEKRYRTLFEESTDAIFIVHPQGSIIDANPSAGELFGVSRAELLEADILQFYVNPPDRLALREVVESKGFVRSVEWKIRRRDGNERTCLMAASAWRDEQGKLLGYIAIAQDITELKRFEEQLRQSTKMEAIGRLAGGIAHDFNNLLTVITGYSTMLAMQLPEASPLAEKLLQIRHAADRAASLTRQLLAFSRKQVLEMKVVDLNDVILDVEKMLRRLLGEDIDLVTIPVGTHARVKADPDQLSQILMNLAVNARDAMPEGGRLTIETGNVVLDATYAETHPEVQPGSYVMLAVSDNGIGMDAQTAAKVFEPFFTTKAKGSGTGLGLATVFGIVKQHGGHITVYSEPGMGTTFRVYLPRTTSAADKDSESHCPGIVSVTGQTILVVEDEQFVRAYACEVLNSLGYVVHEAKDPQEAIALSENEPGPIHLLLTDVILPLMDGKTLFERLVRARPTMRVIYMSGYTCNAIVRHGVLERGIHFLQKPFDGTGLARKVSEALSSSGRISDRYRCD